MANNKIIKSKLSKGKSRSSKDEPKSSKNNNEISKHIIWVEKKGLITGLIDSKLNKKVTKKKLEESFEPSMKMIIRIMDSMVEKGGKSKTNLSRSANLNYTRLVNHIIWLEKKGLVKSTVENSRIKVDLTDKGRIFAATITKK